MGKEAAIESAGIVPIFLPDHEGSSGGPKERGGLVILSLVFLNVVENSSPAERIAVTVDEPSTGSRVFKGVFVALSQKFGLASCYFRMAVHVIM